jgi:hypothetical protein
MAVWPIEQRARDIERGNIPEGPGMRTQDAAKLDAWRREIREARKADLTRDAD